MEKYIQLTADANCIDEAFSFVEGELESLPGISRKEVLKFHMLVDEIFTNITKYAYEEKGRPIMISFSYDEEEKKVRLIFRDEGREYDPTEEEMPDITLPAGKRRVGGLGIFMVKNVVDDLIYERKDGFNVLTIVKTIGDKQA